MLRDGAVIDAAGLKLLKTFAVGPRPRSTAFLPDSSRAYVTAENGGTVHVVDTKTHTVRKTLKITGEMARPMGVIASPDGSRVYVTTGRGQMLLAIDTEKKLADERNVPAYVVFSDATLGYFDFEKKDYKKIPVREQVEVLSLLGDVALKDGEPKLHLHAVLGRSDGAAIGGQGPTPAPAPTP